MKKGMVHSMNNIEYRTAAVSWPIEVGCGNHRFIAEAPAAEYVRATVPWRRRDTAPEKLGIKIRYTPEGESPENGVGSREVTDILIESADREEGVIVFRAPVSGTYEIYSMPFGKMEPWHCPTTHYYTASQMRADDVWARNAVSAAVEQANVIAYESRTDFDSFWPMETIQTAEERKEFFSGNAPFVLVAESRIRPVRMAHDLPLIWHGRDALDRVRLTDTAADNEHYAFQVAVCAAEKLENIRLRFTDETGTEYALDDCICFNLNGTDADGCDMVIRRDVDAGEILSLWCGVRCENLPKRKIIINAALTADNADYTSSVTVTLDKTGEILPRNGDDDMWRMGRLFWLNSTIGRSDEVIPPYTPVKADPEAGVVSILGRRMTVGEFGLPSSVESFYDYFCELPENAAPLQVLESPMELQVSEKGERISFTPEGSSWQNPGTMRTRVDAEFSSASGGLRIESTADYEADGHIDITMKITALRDGDYAFRLHMPVRRAAAPYMMGMCHEGGETPAQWEYRWLPKHYGNYVWLGGPRAGIQVKLMQEDEHWGGVNPLPRLWSNGGKGVLRVTRDDDENTVTFDAYTGEAHFDAGQTEILHLHIMVTPLHPVNYKAHWTDHYYHKNSWHSDEPIPSLENAKKFGAGTVILHQGGPLNENINYPFHLAPKLKEEIDRAHSMGLRYKIYYTVRELSTCTTELWALLSLGEEIFPRGGEDFHVADHFVDDEHRVSTKPTGGPWLMEHLLEGYVPAWHQFLASGEYDCAIRTQSRSRWHNYYLCGLDWLTRVVGIDGLYLDGIGYDRHTMRRVRRVMSDVKRGCDIDIHCGNDHCNEMAYGYGTPACIYLEHYAYADNIWNGEGFDYDNQPPNYYFTEICGLPLGLTGEMLERGGNPWRGMVYGMTARCGWSQGGLSRPIFDVWDDFEISRSKMYGYWNPDCPVNCENDAVRATAYVRDDGEVLVAIGAWTVHDRPVLITVNKQALGIDGDYELYAPPIEDFQPEATFSSTELIPVAAGRGWIFRIRRK